MIVMVFLGLCLSALISVICFIIVSELFDAMPGIKKVFSSCKTMNWILKSLIVVPGINIITLLISFCGCICYFIYNGFKEIDKLIE